MREKQYVFEKKSNSKRNKNKMNLIKYTMFVMLPYFGFMLGTKNNGHEITVFSFIYGLLGIGLAFLIVNMMKNNTIKKVELKQEGIELTFETNKVRLVSYDEVEEFGYHLNTYHDDSGRRTGFDYELTLSVASEKFSDVHVTYGMELEDFGEAAPYIAYFIKNLNEEAMVDHRLLKHLTEVKDDVQNLIKKQIPEDFKEEFAPKQLNMKEVVKTYRKVNQDMIQSHSPIAKLFLWGMNYVKFTIFKAIGIIVLIIIIAIVSSFLK